METRTKAIIASAVVLALLLAGVSGVTYSWFSDTENAGVDVMSGKVSVETSVSSLVDASEDGSTFTAATADEMKNGYNFGFNDEAVATVEDGQVKVENMVANDALTMEVSGTIDYSVSIAYRVSAVVEAVAPATEDDFIVTFYSVNGGSEEEIAQGGKVWTVVKPAAANTTETIDLDDYRIKLRMAPGSNAQSAEATIGMKIEAYQLNAVLPDGSVVRDVVADEKVVQRIATTDSKIESMGVEFTAGTAGTYTIAESYESSGSSSLAVSVDDNRIIRAGLSVSAVDSSKTSINLGSTPAYLTFVLDSSMVYVGGSTTLQTNYSLTHVDSSGSISDVSLKNVTSFTPSAGQYTLTLDETTGKYTMKVYVTGFSSYYLTSKAEAKITGTDGQTEYTALYDALSRMKNGETVALTGHIPSYEPLNFTEPIVGANGTFEGLSANLTKLRMTSMDGSEDLGLDYLFKDPVNLTIKNMQIGVADSSSRIISLVEATNPESVVTIDGVGLGEVSKCPSVGAEAFYVTKFQGKSLTIKNCTTTVNMFRDAPTSASDLVQDKMAVFVGSISLIGDGETEEHEMSVTFSSNKIANKFMGKTLGVYFGTVSNLAEQDVSKLTLTCTSNQYNNSTLYYSVSGSLFGDDAASFNDDGTLSSLKSLFDAATSGTTGTGTWTKLT